MKVAVLSDLHGNYPIIPELHDQHIDLLLVVGDIAGGDTYTHGQTKSMGKFIKWVRNINPKYCVITPGNHDFWTYHDVFKYRENDLGIRCLIDDSCEVDGLRIHGTPWTPKFMNWNWMKEDADLMPHWRNIHTDTDILINHGPMYGVCDHPLQLDGHYSSKHLGCKSLLDNLWLRNIPYFFSGHIHSASHELQKMSNYHDTLCACVSLLDEDYKMKYKPLVLDI